MFGNKRRLRELQAQIEAYKGLVATQAGYIATLQTWHSEHTAQVQRQAAINEALGTVAIALDRHPGDDMSGNPILASAVLLSSANRSTLADDALISLARELHDPLGEAVDGLFV